MTISARLREAVRTSGRSMCATAREAGIDKASLSRFLSGERSLTLESAERLAEALGLRLVAGRRGRRKARKKARR
jgi:DNA-binding phage protein